MKLTKQSMAILAVAAPSFATPVPGIFDPIACWFNPIVNPLKTCAEASPLCSSVLHISTVTKSEDVTVTHPITTTVVATIGTQTITPVVTSYTTITTTYTDCKKPSGKRDYYPPPPYPTPALPCGISSAAPSSQISEACSCLSLPTPTTTVCNTATVIPTVIATSSVVVTVTGSPSTTTATSTVTVTSTGCPLPTTCGNLGIEWAYFHNPSHDETGNWDFTPENDKKRTPLYQGTEDTVAPLSNQDSAQPIIINGNTVKSAYFDLAHRFFIYIATGGTYTFNMYNVDDRSYLWVGTMAYSGWDHENYRSYAKYAGGVASTTYSVSLQEYAYYSVRILYGQSGGPLSFKFNLTGPDGTALIGPGVKTSQNILKFGCPDNGGPPKFPPFGQET
ncbi:hypothetical protein PT974_12148 [Cladobotryum mycophilum]|uniref:PA14 domain-containing protein n=1 Tax=Cladobotryum mycophilum TaxID=491253 RepID=A0ABR0S765_9HYPO